MKYSFLTLFFCFLLGLCLLIVPNLNALFNDEQAPALLLDINTTIQPIVENDELPMADRYIRTLKVTYTDYFEKPLVLRNGDKLYNRCSFQTVLKFESPTGETLEVLSWKRMSCEIVAFVDLSPSDVEWLKRYQFTKITITNLSTNSELSYVNTQPNFLRDLLILYNK